MLLLLPYDHDRAKLMLKALSLFLALVSSAIMVIVLGTLASITGSVPHPHIVLAGTAEKTVPIHDLAVSRIEARMRVNVTAEDPSATQSVLITMQNRSDHDEKIDENIHLGNGITTGLIRLNVSVIDDDNEGCLPAKVVPRPRPLLAGGPKLLIRPMSGYSVSFEVTYHCAAAKPEDRRDPTPWDYSFWATVHHEVLDGNLDSEPSDDVCPRQPIPPKRGIEDRGCGWRLRGKPFDPYVSDVILKSPEKR